MKTFAHRFAHAWLLDGVRTPMVDYCGAFGDISPTDMGIKVARAVIERAGVAASDVDSVITGSMAQADFDAYMLPRHIGLYAGVPLSTPAILVQRICGTGFELLRQAADQIALGYADLALVVGAESMTRNPIAAYNHRTGFKLGAPVGFKDFLMEALIDTAVPVTMIETAENLARLYGISRVDVDRYACRSFELALKAQADGFLAGEIVPVQSETFALAGYHPRGIRLPRKVAQVAQDTHPRPSPVDALAQLRTVYEGGVQTAGNSSALVDGAAGALVASDAYVQRHALKPLARLVGAAAVGVAPEIMGIGPAPAIRALLERCGLSLNDIDLFEINEAQGAQTIAVERELGLDRNQLNVNGGAIALGHPLAATGLRLTITLARELRRRGLRYGVASACVGGGQGMALLVEV
ncbi:MAG: thiolase family protein [Betaproteobacteria bacterium]|uniref:Acetyl-CoA acetyltransferase n=1 Tax=Serpentinimonas maccroryi TaxID=1458426 RepID=A0A060NMN3_9BURK|nr:thiolase family protein [Serpentinimonas maccroryi]MCL5969829.1 thiolase family protein [Betaproteobacteria bacterium]BAO83037.1 acetyl-CoA acetyltransferase [Serpentinimonas maccroryi]